MNIRQKIIASIILIGAFSTTLSTISLRNALHEKENFSNIKINISGNQLLLQAAGALAKERTLTTAALLNDKPAEPQIINELTKIRSEMTEQFADGLAELERIDFPRKEQLIDDLKQNINKLINLRAEVDLHIAKIKTERDAPLSDKFIKQSLSASKSNQELRFVLAQEASNFNPELGRHSFLRHFISLTSFNAGRERTQLAAALIAGGLEPKTLTQLAQTRGKIEQNWDSAINLAAFSSPEVKSALEAAGSAFFSGRYESLRDAQMNAMLAGSPPTTSAASFIETAGEAIDAFTQAQTASVTESNAYITAQERTLGTYMTLNILTIIIDLLMITGAYYFVSMRVSRPLEEMSDAMTRIARGDLHLTVPGTGRDDEIGRMAASVQIFKNNEEERRRLIEEQKRAEAQMAETRKRAMHELAESFRHRVQGAIKNISASATQLSGASEHVNSVVQRSTKMAETATVKAAETTADVQSVAAAAEEMSATVKEISFQINKTNDLVRRSVEKVDGADKHAQALTEATSKVKDVTQLIARISEQINLLALNATIESSRAGEAGRGFAVVAGEVKNLAGQTDKSIQEIEHVITEMNNASGNIVTALGEIKKSVADISETSGSVASAVEEQATTTNEISSNMQSAAHGVKTVSVNLGEISSGTTLTGTASAQALAAAQDLAKQAEFLDKEVDGFIKEIRAA